MNNIRRLFYIVFTEGIKGAIPVFNDGDNNPPKKIDVSLNYIGDIIIDGCDVAIYGARFQTKNLGDVLMVGIPVAKKTYKRTMSMKDLPYDIIYMYRGADMYKLKEHFKTLNFENLFLLPTLAIKSNNPSGIQAMLQEGDIHQLVYTPMNGSFAGTFSIFVNTSKSEPIDETHLPLEDLILRKTCTVLIN